MKVKSADGRVVEIPEAEHISPLRHVGPGVKITPCHQWPNVVVVQRGWDGRAYYDAAYFYSGKTYLPLEIK